MSSYFDPEESLKDRDRHELFKGKTIARVDSYASNVWHFHCTDGAVIVLQVDPEPEQKAKVRTLPKQ